MELQTSALYSFTPNIGKSQNAFGVSHHWMYKPWTYIFYWVSELSGYSSVKRYYSSLMVHLKRRVHSRVSAVAEVWQGISAAELRETTGSKPVWHLWRKSSCCNLTNNTKTFYCTFHQEVTKYFGKVINIFTDSLQIYWQSCTPRVEERNWENIQIWCL